MREIVIVGFPKCGTSALLRRFAEEDDVQVLLSPTGSVDARFPDRSVIEPGKRVVHKYPSYILSREDLLRLRDEIDAPHLVLCYRPLPRVLLSWHNMHRRLARTGKHPNHFVQRDPEFWANCSVDDYYRRSVHRFRIDMFFERIVRMFPAEALTVVAQERMARSLANVVKELKGEAAVEAEEPAHQGYADRADVAIDPQILGELDATFQRFLERVAQDGVRHLA